MSSSSIIGFQTYNLLSGELDMFTTLYHLYTNTNGGIT